MLLASMVSPPLIDNLVGPAAIERCCCREPANDGSTCNDLLQSQREREGEREREREREGGGGGGGRERERGQDLVRPLLYTILFGPSTTPYQLHTIFYNSTSLV